MPHTNDTVSFGDAVRREHRRRHPIDETASRPSGFGPMEGGRRPPRGPARTQ